MESIELLMYEYILYMCYLLLVKSTFIRGRMFLKGGDNVTTLKIDKQSNA